MIKANNGKGNETAIINYINKKRTLSEMNDNIKNFVKFLFPEITESNSVTAKKYGENYKPDIVIEFDNKKKYISIKSGDCNSIHQEHIYSFTNYIENLGANKETISLIKKFHFNDNTLDGTGEFRRSASEYQLYNQKDIQIINNFFNKEEIQQKLIKRILIKGEYHHAECIDAIYHGTIEKGIWATSQEIIDYLSKEKVYSASPHISKIYYQSLHRNLKYDIYFEFRRYYVQFKWYSLKQDLITITKKRE